MQITPFEDKAIYFFMPKWNIFHSTVDSQDGDDDAGIVACEKYYHKTVGAEHVTSSSAPVKYKSDILQHNI